MPDSKVIAGFKKIKEFFQLWGFAIVSTAVWVAFTRWCAQHFHHPHQRNSDPDIVPAWIYVWLPNVLNVILFFLSPAWWRCEPVASPAQVELMRRFHIFPSTVTWNGIILPFLLAPILLPMIYTNGTLRGILAAYPSAVSILVDQRRRKALQKLYPTDEAPRCDVVEATVVDYEYLDIRNNDKKNDDGRTNDDLLRQVLVYVTVHYSVADQSFEKTFRATGRRGNHFGCVSLRDYSQLILMNEDAPQSALPIHEVRDDLFDHGFFMFQDAIGTVTFSATLLFIGFMCYISIVKGSFFASSPVAETPRKLFCDMIICLIGLAWPVFSHNPIVTFSAALLFIGYMCYNSIGKDSFFASSSVAVTPWKIFCDVFLIALAWPVFSHNPIVSVSATVLFIGFTCYISMVKDSFFASSSVAGIPWKIFCDVIIFLIALAWPVFSHNPAWRKRLREGNGCVDYLQMETKRL